jgi:anti-sigma-K factor RskA
MNHARIEELLAVRTLGGLGEDDAATLEAEMATHGDCEECRRIEREFAETAGLFAFALDPVAVDPGMADRILATGRTDTAAPAVAGDELASRRPGRGWRTFVAVAAAFAILAVVAIAAAPRPGRITAVSAQPAQTIVRFEGEAGSLAMAYSPGESGVIFWGSDLPDPGADHVYEIWMIQGETPVSGGCVTPGADGNLAAFVDADVGSADLMAVTVEPASCPGSPTGDPVLTAPLDVA